MAGPLIGISEMYFLKTISILLYGFRSYANTSNNICLLLNYHFLPFLGGDLKRTMPVNGWTLPSYRTCSLPVMS